MLLVSKWLGAEGLLQGEDVRNGSVFPQGKGIEAGGLMQGVRKWILIKCKVK